MLRGVGALEQLIDGNSDFCLGDTLTMADLFFVPQMRNVVDRFKIDVSAYPKVDRLYKKLQERISRFQSHPHFYFFSVKSRKKQQNPTKRTRMFQINASYITTRGRCRSSCQMKLQMENKVLIVVFVAISVQSSRTIRWPL